MKFEPKVIRSNFLHMTRLYKFTFIVGIIKRVLHKLLTLAARISYFNNFVSNPFFGARRAYKMVLIMIVTKKEV